MWRTHGSAALKSTFYSTAVRDRERAARYLNDADTSFPVLFILMPELEKLGLYKELSARNLHALRVCARKQQKLEAYLTHLSGEIGEDAAREYYHWMVETGIGWDGPSAGRDEFDEVIDRTAALLIAAHSDDTLLVPIAELIFRRNRRGLFIHDLVWGFFQSADAAALAVIAKYIRSKDDADTQLACELLGLNAPEGESAKREVFDSFSEWLGENRPYLYLTGEHFQATSAPRPLGRDLEAKYLHREISPKDRAPKTPLEEHELKALEQFREAEREEQELLSAHSHKLHGKDKNAWGNWLGRHIAEQVMAARGDKGEMI
jgi:hypothetical protein